MKHANNGIGYSPLIKICWLLTVLVMSGCNTSLSQLNHRPGDSNIERFEDDSGNLELILEPIPVWDDEGAGVAELATIDGRSLYFRQRSAELFDKPWVRLGLFWNAKLEEVMLLIVLSGPPVDIRKVNLSTDGRKSLLKKAKNFKFKPAKKTFDKELSSTVSSMKLKTFYQFADAKDATILLQTSRGSLKADLSVVTDSSVKIRRSSVKYQFAKFADDMRDYIASREQ